MLPAVSSPFSSAPREKRCKSPPTHSLAITGRELAFQPNSSPHPRIHLLPLFHIPTGMHFSGVLPCKLYPSHILTMASLAHRPPPHHHHHLVIIIVLVKLELFCPLTRCTVQTLARLLLQTLRVAVATAAAGAVLAAAVLLVTPPPHLPPAATLHTVE